jgi:S1-C subfamily serine protease
VSAIRRERSSTLETLSDDLAAAVERAAASVVAVHARPRIASSAVLWRPGVVVTADHTVRRDEAVTVTLSDGRSVAATLAGRDGATDVAVLRIAANGVPVADFAAPGSLNVGHVVLQVGRTGSGGHSASFGVVGAMVGPWRTWRGAEIARLIQLDLAIHDGFSGSPLVDAEGKVVGLNTSGLARGLALALPVAVVDPVVDALLAKGRIARGYLGVGLQPVALPPALGRKYDPPRQSALVVLSVDPDGPSERGGLQLGDVIVDVDQQPVADVRDVLSLLGPERVGSALRLGVVRGGAPIAAVSVTIAERPAR